MPVQQAVWRISELPQRLNPSRLDSERQLEDLIVADPSILSSNWMIIGRQVATDFRGFVDLIALQPDGTPVIIELKKEKTPREVLAQTLDYASWVESLTPSRLQTIYENFITGGNLARDFATRFGAALDEEALNRDHLMVIVATELDNSTERIVKFLSKRSLNINVLFFQIFENGPEKFLSRAWLVDPTEVQVAVTSAGEPSGIWNGEFYASFGEGPDRSWSDARKFGFLTASGGSWYTQTLAMLNPDDRVWVNVPTRGYVGVGVVSGAVVPLDELTVTVDGNDVLFASLPEAEKYRGDVNPENQAFFVPITWVHSVPLAEAVKEVGFFGNQNTVAKPKSEKWEHTVAVLKQRFGI
jgi:hypothetical protein